MKAYTLILFGAAVPAALRKLGRDDLAAEAEALPDLDRREVHLDIGWVKGEPVLLERLGI